jgi:tetratricopeptide (TPR) repeat protein
MALALAAAGAGRFVELVKEDAVAPGEAAARQVLRVLALYALGDSPASLSAPLRQSAQHPAVLMLTGAVRALEGNDRDAVAAWDAAVAAGVDARVLGPPMIDALLRQGDGRRALEIAQGAPAADARIRRRLAATHLVMGRYDEALRTAEAILAQQPNDLDAQWIAIHALFASFVTNNGFGPDAVSPARLSDLAAKYVSAKGPHAALAQEWAAVMAK